MEEVLRIQNLDFFYGRQQILDQVEVSIAAGECLGILGSNGSGKTTLIHCILGENEHPADSVWLFGQRYDGREPQAKRQLGVVPDNELLLDYLTMGEYLRFMGTAFGMEPETAEETMEQWSRRLSMDSYYNKMLKTFSHGMKKKVQMIGALMHSPRFLIIDEPTNGLDIETIAELKQILASLKEEGVAVLISTHILEFAEKVCSEVMILHNRRLSEKLSMQNMGGNLEQVFLEHIHGGHV